MIRGEQIGDKGVTVLEDGKCRTYANIDFINSKIPKRVKDQIGKAQQRTALRIAKEYFLDALEGLSRYDDPTELESVRINELNIYIEVVDAELVKCEKEV